MRPVRSIILAAIVSMMAQSALAFQETTVGGSNQQPGAVAPNREGSDTPTEAGKGLNLSVPDAVVGSSAGKEVRIPGLGSVGVLPKLDFGLELLYGANDSKANGIPDDRIEKDDVQIRGTIKHRF